MTDIHQKREWVKALYPGSKRWARKVAKMPDAQVIAIYLKHQEQPKEEPKHEDDSSSHLF